MRWLMELKPDNIFVVNILNNYIYFILHSLKEKG